MHPDDLKYPAIFHDGYAQFLERSESDSRSYIGGAFPGSVTGARHGPRPLHHLGNIANDCLGALECFVRGSGLPLMYGMCYDGCSLTYQVFPTGIEVLKIDPTSSDESWPYPGYPPLLPLVPLRLDRRVRCSLNEFAGLSCQPLRALEKQAIVLIPSIPAPGLSLWGPNGEGECVQIVLNCDLLNGVVEAYNQCG